MIEQTWKPEITGLADEVTMTLPYEQYIKMPSEMARALARKLLLEAARAEGQPPGHLLVMEMPNS